MVGMHLPGAGALWTQQSFQWRAPSYIGDVIRFTLKVTQKSEGTRTLAISLSAVNQAGTLVMEGEGAVKLLETREKTAAPAVAGRVAWVTNQAQPLGQAIAAGLEEIGARGSDSAEGATILVVTPGVALTPHGALIESAAALEASWSGIVRPALECVAAAAPAMREAGNGSVVLIAPPKAGPQFAALQVARAALRELNKALAAELGPKGIRVNLILPGLTETEDIAAVPDRVRKLVAMQTPLRKLCTVDDIVAAALFLCSPGAQFLSGAEIPVTGGAEA
jgi:3-oxoacyl-[acyl-carrier protein] reductase